MKSKYSAAGKILTVFFVLLSLVWLFPIFEVVINSFKENAFVNLEPFALPTAESFVGLANYVKDRLADREDIVRSELFLTYTPVTDDCLAAVKEAIAAYGNFDTVYETTAGCTVSCHCGPGTLGVLFVRK